ncbi:hypothetical protein BDV25DRAFT_140679 [Aspergillus avenaceus]|uniref:Uncharacterized protein n=1 Tax=Aspergillus avenaceus TaxID=36643 RepID=A0A5N6TT78_ASPAV|nr:hypothetical protein BDV25DRAFT_140679 [Aspergillus avenaceus]
MHSLLLITLLITTTKAHEGHPHCVFNAASNTHIVPETGQLCHFLDCGGVKAWMPNCPSYTMAPTSTPPASGSGSDITKATECSSGAVSKTKTKNKTKTGGAVSSGTVSSSMWLNSTTTATGTPTPSGNGNGTVTASKSGSGTGSSSAAPTKNEAGLVGVRVGLVGVLGLGVLGLGV